MVFYVFLETVLKNSFLKQEPNKLMFSFFSCNLQASEKGLLTHDS